MPDLTAFLYQRMRDYCIGAGVPFQVHAHMVRHATGYLSGECYVIYYAIIVIIRFRRLRIDAISADKIECIHV